jgi:NitT/TauT family transport system permease protein
MSRVGVMAWPAAIGILLLAAWEVAVHAFAVPSFVLPPPSAIARSLIVDGPGLLAALVETLKLTLAAFAASLVGGLALAILFTRDRRIEAALRPWAVVLQVTPIVAIAPMVVIWVGIDHVERAVFVLATIVGFFPLLANASFGLRDVDPGLSDLFRLYGASRAQRLLRLELPTALPAILAGARISAGLALIGTVVAEFAAGSGEAKGLAWRIAESGARLEIPRLFASLFLLALAGIALNGLLAWVEKHIIAQRRLDARSNRDL